MICETCSPPVTDPVLFWVAGIIILVVIVVTALIIAHHRRVREHIVTRVETKLDQHMDQIKAMARRQ